MFIGILKVNIIENVYWKEFGLLVLVWVAFLAIQIAMVCYFSVNVFFITILFLINFTQTFLLTMLTEPNNQMFYNILGIQHLAGKILIKICFVRN